MPIHAVGVPADDRSTLDYQALLDEVMGLGQSARFPQARLTSAKRWLAAAYQQVWVAADWTFRKAINTSWPTVNAGLDPSATPVMPADFAQVLPGGVYDDNGDSLPQLTREELQAIYRPYAVDGATGRPEAFALVNRQILLGPAPDQSYAFTLDYHRRLSHKDTAGTIYAGFFPDDQVGRVPLWDDHHYILVPRAQVIGLKSLNDPTWPPLQDEYQQLLGSMLVDYVDYGRRQYARDPDH